MKNQEIASAEFSLNLKNQIIESKIPLMVGYEFEKGIYIFALLLPKGYLNIKGCELGK